MRIASKRGKAHSRGLPPYTTIATGDYSNLPFLIRNFVHRPGRLWGNELADNPDASWHGSDFCRWWWDVGERGKGWGTISLRAIGLGALVKVRWRMIPSGSALDTCARAGVEYFIYRYPPRRQGSFPITVQNKLQQQTASQLQRVLTVSASQASQGLTRRYLEVGQAKRKWRPPGQWDGQRVADRGRL